MTTKVLKKSSYSLQIVAHGILLAVKQLQDRGYTITIKFRQ